MVDDGSTERLLVAQLLPQHSDTYGRSNSVTCILMQVLKRKTVVSFQDPIIFSNVKMFVLMVSDLDLAVASSPPNKALSPNSPKKSPDSGTCHRYCFICRNYQYVGSFLVHNLIEHYSEW